MHHFYDIYIYNMCNIQTTESLHGFEKVFTNMHCKNISVKNIIQSTDTDFTFLDIVIIFGFHKWK